MLFIKLPPCAGRMADGMADGLAILCHCYGSRGKPEDKWAQQLLSGSRPGTRLYVLGDQHW